MVEQSIEDLWRAALAQELNPYGTLDETELRLDELVRNPGAAILLIKAGHETRMWLRERIKAEKMRLMLAGGPAHTSAATPHRDGEPCDHPGCLRHVTHPCEGCGRVGGRAEAITARGSDVMDTSAFPTPEQLQWLNDRADWLFEMEACRKMSVDGPVRVDRIRYAVRRGEHEVES